MQIHLQKKAQLFFAKITDVTSITNAWWYSIEYTISYYFDLSAYADMAIGIGLLFNIIIPENFNSPYKARNFQDYWQRWHMTLSRFLGAYIFRSVYRKESKWRNYYVATMVTFLVSGFWHGAGWTFVIWGLVNGVFVCTASWMKRHNYSFPSAISHILTILGIILTRILFVSKDFNQATTMFKSLVNYKDISFFSVGPGISGKIALLSLVAGCFIIFFTKNTSYLSKTFKPNVLRLLLIGLAIGLSVAFMGSATSFLYFQF